MTQHGGYVLGGEHGGWVFPEGFSVAAAGPHIAGLTLLFWTACLLLHSGATLYSLSLYSKVFAYMFCSKDTKWKPVADPGTIAERGKVEDCTVIFIRHGESTWNETFNPTGIRKVLFPFGVITAVITESMLLLKGQRDSWFYDSPLNHIGHEQANDLKLYLSGNSYNKLGLTAQEKRDLEVLRGDDTATPSVLVSSVLRRAVSTVAIALNDRLAKTGEKIVWLPCCQEISRNPDTLCITPAFDGKSNKAQASKFDESAVSVGVDLKAAYGKTMDLSQHTGNKPLSSNGGKRLHEFAQWCFDRGPKSVGDQPPYIIVGGHSLWFKAFFKEFLPHHATEKWVHRSRNKKLKNGGAVAFTLRSYATTDGKRQYKILPESMRVVFQGWQS